MKSLFSHCKKLSTLSDISKWNTKNAHDMSFMFYSCESLSSLPDISNWNINNNINGSNMLSNCPSLSFYLLFPNGIQIKK